MMLCVLSAILSPCLMAGADADQNGEALSPAGIERIMHKVNDYQRNHPCNEKKDNGWIRSTYQSGVLSFYQATGKRELLDQVLRWGKKHEWKIGGGPGANRLFCSMIYAELNLMNPDPAMIAPTLEWLKKDDPRSPGGPKIWFSHAPPKDQPLYADSLYSAAVFAILHKTTGDQKYLDTLDHFFWTVTDAILDQEACLYYRDYRAIANEDAAKNLHYKDVPDDKRRETVFYQVSKNGKKVLWSRGNGWVVGGLPRILMHLPKGHSSYLKYEQLFTKMACSLKDRQGDDGYWRPNLDDADDYPMPETSGTGFYVYGLAWGINNGVLPKDDFLPFVQKGWKALCDAVSDEGKVQWGQLVAGGPYEVRKEDSHEYVTGAFLLAGSEMLKLARSLEQTAPAAKRPDIVFVRTDQ